MAGPSHLEKVNNICFTPETIASTIVYKLLIYCQLIKVIQNMQKQDSHQYLQCFTLETQKYTPKKKKKAKTLIRET